MIGKLSLVVAFGAGYVLGAKAGTQRYEKIRHTAQGIAQQPLVQSATDKVQTKATEAKDAALGRAAEKTHDAVGAAKAKAAETATTVKDKVLHLDHEPAEGLEADPDGARDPLVAAQNSTVNGASAHPLS